MSDRNTAAMLPKEQPKTCGTCGHGRMAIACKYAGNHCGKWIEDAENHENWMHRTSDEAPEWCYKPRTDEWGLTEQDRAVIKMAAEYDDLNERYQQLADVARDMWISLISTDDLFIKDRANRHREQLEALGVSVDD